MSIQASLTERRDEILYHLSLADALQDRMFGDDPSVGSINLSIRHINSLKSGIIVHIYNVVEAIMSQIEGLLGEALCNADPERWTDHSMREWLRAATADALHNSTNEKARITAVNNASRQLVSRSLKGPRRLKKPAGTWNDEKIVEFAKRVGVNFQPPPELLQRCMKSKKYGDKTPLTYLSKKRNEIAHGERTFENGANELLLSDLRALSEIVIDFMSFVADSFSNHVNNEKHLVKVT